MDNQEKKAFEEMMKAFDRLSLVIESKKDEIREFISSKNVCEMKGIMNEFKTLENFCIEFGALENENYEICHVAQEILHERKLKK
jgi:hypothetical protein